MAEFTVSVSNCNSIDLAEIAIAEGTLNIKYGPNGVGKSTLARAVISQIRGDGSLGDLLPFKCRGKEDAALPKVDGADHLKSALVFDDSYVQQFVFQKDEVLKNSFEIFIMTPQYIEEMAEIDDLLSGIRKAFADSADIAQVTTDLRELREAFGKPAKGGAIPKSSKIHKALSLETAAPTVPVDCQTQGKKIPL
jgi:ABC-type uncharacterized transport system ATPase subunit